MTSSRDTAGEWTPGQMVPGTIYRLERTLGQGGMGEVYEVEHTMLGCRRALKVLARDLGGREDLAERLRAEARGLARLHHPNIVEVFDLAFASDGRIFLVMELLRGQTLRAVLRQQRRLEPPRAVRVMAQVLDALGAAHQAQLIHRDIKPENIFVCPGEAIKLLDFGVAKAIDAWTAGAQLTAAGMTVGTPRYMAPEQTTGRPVDARTDVYAAGLVLWEALAGRPAFDDADPVQLARNKLDYGVPSIADAVSGLSPALAAAVMRACARQPADRFPGAQPFAAELRRAVGEQGEAAAARTPTPAPGADATVVDAMAVEPTTVAEGGRNREATTAPDAADQRTERLEAVAPVDRDAPTRWDEQQAPRAGPTGTRMLPAVAAREPEPAQQEHQRPAQALAESAAAGPSRLMKIAAVAFLLPVLIAALIGALYVLTRHRQAAPPVVSEPAPGEAPSAQVATIEVASASASASAPASSTAPATPSAIASASAAPGPAGQAAKKRQVPAKPPAAGLPASGL